MIKYLVQTKINRYHEVVREIYILTDVQTNMAITSALCIIFYRAKTHNNFFSEYCVRDFWTRNHAESCAFVSFLAPTLGYMCKVNLFRLLSPNPTQRQTRSRLRSLLDGTLPVMQEGGRKEREELVKLR